MPRINGQLFVYLAIGLVLALVGLNSIRGEKKASGGFPASPAAAGSGAPVETDDLRIDAGSRKLVVDVAGAVRRPGVYRFPQGARVIDAITRAGGPNRRAMTGAINRAAILTDGQQVVVPLAVGPGGGSSGSAGGLSAGVGDLPVSLGTATRGQLEQIDGIGPVTAAKILEFRQSRGGLGSVEELDQISGIGPATMESLRSALAP